MDVLGFYFMLNHSGVHLLFLGVAFVSYSERERLMMWKKGGGGGRGEEGGRRILRSYTKPSVQAPMNFPDNPMP